MGRGRQTLPGMRPQPHLCLGGCETVRNSGHRGHPGRGGVGVRESGQGQRLGPHPFRLEKPLPDSFPPTDTHLGSCPVDHDKDNNRKLSLSPNLGSGSAQSPLRAQPLSLRATGRGCSVSRQIHSACQFSALGMGRRAVCHFRDSEMLPALSSSAGWMWNHEMKEPGSQDGQKG